MKSKEFIIARPNTLREAPEDWQGKYSQGWRQAQASQQAPQQTPQGRSEPRIPPETTQPQGGPTQTQGSRAFNRFKVHEKVKQNLQANQTIHGERRLMNPATVGRFAKFFKHPITRGVGNFVAGAVFWVYILPYLLEYLYDEIIPRFSNDPNVVNAAKESAKEIEAAQKEQTQNQTLTPETEQKIKDIFNDLRETFKTTTQPAQPVQK